MCELAALPSPASPPLEPALFERHVVKNRAGEWQRLADPAGRPACRARNGSVRKSKRAACIFSNYKITSYRNSNSMHDVMREDNYCIPQHFPVYKHSICNPFYKLYKSGILVDLWTQTPKLPNTSSPSTPKPYSSKPLNP